MADWLLGLAMVIATAPWENDLDRIRIATISAVVLGGPQPIAAARYQSDLRDGVSTTLYIGFLVS